MIESIITLALLAGVSFAQNMMFTLVSRSRAAGDTSYHRFCAWGSNGVWIICYLLILKNVWASVQAGNWLYAGIAVIIYTLATTEGSVLMMKRLLKSEKGSRKVGATGGESDPDKLLARIKDLESRDGAMADRLSAAKITTMKALSDRIKDLEAAMDAIKNFDDYAMERINKVKHDLETVKAIQALDTTGGSAMDMNLMKRITNIEERLLIPFNDGSQAYVLKRLAAVEHAVKRADLENAEIEAENTRIDLENEENDRDYADLKRRVNMMEVRSRVNRFLRNKLSEKVSKLDNITHCLDSALYDLIYRASDDPEGGDEEFDVQERIIQLENILSYISGSRI